MCECSLCIRLWRVAHHHAAARQQESTDQSSACLFKHTRLIVVADVSEVYQRISGSKAQARQPGRARASIRELRLHTLALGLQGSARASTPDIKC